jgi:RND family efflux transporter MFP subunit
MQMVPVFAEDASGGTARDSVRNPADSILTTPGQRQLIGIQYGVAEWGRARRTLRAAATVSADENRVARVQTHLEGTVEQVYVNAPGVTVKRGQTLLTIYNPKSQLAQQQYLQAMEVAGVNMLSPEYIAAHANNRSLPEESQTLAARMQLEQLGFSDAQIETIGRTHTAATRLPVVSPLAGVVLEYNVQPRQKVTAESLYVIADLTKVRVTADFQPTDQTAIEPGQRARFTVPWLPGRSFEGTVDTVLPTLDPTTRSLRVRMLFSNPELLLLPEMQGEVELQTGAGPRRLLVPSGAVVASSGGNVVFVDLGDGRFAPRAVEIAENFGDRIAVSKGLSAGERVVASGNFLLDSEFRMRAH